MINTESVVNNDDLEILLEVKNFYDYILDETVELMNLYNCKTPLEIYCLFNFINGYYVKDDEISKLLHMKKLIYSLELEKNEIQGIQVLLNGGVCRHRSAMLNDIYKKMGIDSVALLGLSEMLLNFHYANFQNKKIADRMYVENMLRKLSEGAKIEEFKTQLKKRKISYHMQDVHDDYYYKHMKLPNHVIVMTGKEKKYYLDPMNNITYYKDDKDVVTLRNASGFYFFTEFGINKLFWGCTQGKKQELVETYDRILQLPGAIESETIHIIKDIYFYLKQYEIEIEKFVEEHQESIEQTRKKCLILGR